VVEVFVVECNTSLDDRSDVILAPQAPSDELVDDHVFDGEYMIDGPGQCVSLVVHDRQQDVDCLSTSMATNQVRRFAFVGDYRNLAAISRACLPFSERNPA